MNPSGADTLIKTPRDKVQLGCGTLILIALIVLIFSGGGTKNVENQIKSLRNEIIVLESKVGELSRTVEAECRCAETEIQAGAQQSKVDHDGSPADNPNS